MEVICQLSRPRGYEVFSYRLIKMAKDLNLTIKESILFHQFVNNEIQLFDDPINLFIDNLDMCLSYVFGSHKAKAVTINKDI